MDGPSWLPGFRVCAWRVVSLDAVTMAALEGDVRTAHPGAAIVTSCQRLEAYGFEPCACGAPVRLEGRAALDRLAARRDAAGASSRRPGTALGYPVGPARLLVSALERRSSVTEDEG